MDRDKSTAVLEARLLAEKAAKAQQAFSKYSQEEVDYICSALAMAGENAAPELARMAVEETKMGRVEDKTFKNVYTSRVIWDRVKHIKTVGIKEYDQENRVIRIYEPVGVIAALVPVTNPTSTVLFNCIIALKSRNAIVFSAHPRSYKCSNTTVQLMEKTAVGAGAPPGLINSLTQISMAATEELLISPHVNLILGTGGGAMLKAVYSAGKPSIGAGPGNVPVYIDRSCHDLKRAVDDIFYSKLFDNGTACASEQAIIVDQKVDLNLRKILREAGAYFLNAAEKKKLAREVVTEDGIMNVDIVARSVGYIAERASLTVPPDAKLLVAEINRVGRDEPFSREILAPIVAYCVVDDWEKGLEITNDLLRLGGLGHTSALHADNKQVISDFSEASKAYRVIVNGPALFGAMGYTTGFEATFMLGTGTIGGSITADNIGPQHLLNVKKVGFPIERA